MGAISSKLLSGDTLKIPRNKIPKVKEIKNISICNDSICCSISGSGPSIFSLVNEKLTVPEYKFCAIVKHHIFLK